MDSDNAIVLTPNKLRVLRKLAGLNQAKMAQAIGLKFGAYSDLERGVTKIKRVHELAVRHWTYRTFGSERIDNTHVAEESSKQQCEEAPKHIWMVQHNLAGLQRPYKLIYDDAYEGWYDESGDVGEDNYEKNLNFPEDITDNDAITRYFFRTEAEANKCFEILDRYRTSLKARM